MLTSLGGLRLFHSGTRWKTCQAYVLPAPRSLVPHSAPSCRRPRQPPVRHPSRPSSRPWKSVGRPVRSSAVLAPSAHPPFSPRPLIRRSRSFCPSVLSLSAARLFCRSRAAALIRPSFPSLAPSRLCRPSLSFARPPETLGVEGCLQPVPRLCCSMLIRFVPKTFPRLFPFAPDLPVSYPFTPRSPIPPKPSRVVIPVLRICQSASPLLAHLP